MEYQEFESIIYENLENPKMKDFLLRFIGFNHYEKGLATDECIYKAYEEMSEERFRKFEKELLEIIK